MRGNKGFKIFQSPIMEKGGAHRAFRLKRRLFSSEAAMPLYCRGFIFKKKFNFYYLKFLFDAINFKKSLMQNLKPVMFIQKKTFSTLFIKSPFYTIDQKMFLLKKRKNW